MRFRRQRRTPAAVAKAAFDVQGVGAAKRAGGRSDSDRRNRPHVHQANVRVRLLVRVLDNRVRVVREALQKTTSHRVSKRGDEGLSGRTVYAMVFGLHMPHTDASSLSHERSSPHKR